MRVRFVTWLQNRTGYQDVLKRFRQRRLPDGPHWAHTTASALFWMLIVEVITGFLLMTSYSPSITSAWASVYYIETLPGGAFLRGVHYWGSHALIILFALHTIRVLLLTAFRAPRELIWVTGMLLIPLLVAWSVTGNPLAATQKGYAQIEVESNIVGSTPIIGPVARQVLIGGDSVGHLTITHLNFLHVALLPVLVTVLTFIHLWQIYRHGSYVSQHGIDDEDATPYWPHQTVRNFTVTSIVFAIVFGLAWRYGAPLEMPADPAFESVPRPEWYFLFLFELRGLIHGEWEFVATIVIPTVTLLLLLTIPVIDRVLSERASWKLRTLIVVVGVVAWSGLTLSSVVKDRNAQSVADHRLRSEELAQRARELARQGIPPEGAIALLRNDPKTQGPILFKMHCASCHSHASPEGEGIVAEEPSAPNLYHFGSRGWVRKVLTPDEFTHASMFGNTSLSDGSMAQGVTDEFEENEIEQMIVALSAQAELKSQRDDDEASADDIQAGTALIQNSDRGGCVMCHKSGDEGELGSAPDLTNYGSRNWMIKFISNPKHERFYAENNDRMPSFAIDQANPEKNLLEKKSIGLLVDWIRGEWFERDQIAEE